MTTHTDRIRQMAQEAGFERFKDESVDPINFEPSPDGMWVLWDDDALARFAQLVAEIARGWLMPQWTKKTFAQKTPRATPSAPATA